MINQKQKVNPLILAEVGENMGAVRELERLFEKFYGDGEHSLRRFKIYEPKILFQMLMLDNCPNLAKHYEQKYKALHDKVRPPYDSSETAPQFSIAFQGGYRKPVPRSVAGYYRVDSSQEFQGPSVIDHGWTLGEPAGRST